MQAMQEKQNDLMSHYNLFSQQPAVFTKTKRSPKPLKTQIQIVFQHPNLLYLSDKRIKTKQEISETVERKLLQLIKNRLKNKSEVKKSARPATSYFSYTQNRTEPDSKEQPFRCITTAQPRGAKQRRKKMEMQAYLNGYRLQEGIGSMENQGFLEQHKPDIDNRQKDNSLNRSFLKRTKPCSEPKLNMYIEMQRRIFNYKNQTKKSNMKKSRNTTLKQF